MGDGEAGGNVDAGAADGAGVDVGDVVALLVHAASSAATSERAMSRRIVTMERHEIDRVSGTWASSDRSPGRDIRNGSPGSALTRA